MSEQPVKKELTPEQATIKQMTNHIHTMPNHQMSNRLKRLSRNQGLKLKKSPLSNIDMAWATVLSIIFDSTRETGGKMESYLR